MQIFFALVSSLFFFSEAQAVPTRTEVYRSDKLKTIIYKDNEDPTALWFLAPVKLLENDGKIVYYRRPKNDQIFYSFYIVPFMSEEMFEILAQEVPGLVNRSQLKPLSVVQFGLRLNAFQALFNSEIATNHQYLNEPAMMTFALSQVDAEEFDFYLSAIPGVPAQVLFTYLSEKLDKYLSVELSYKEIYDAMKIGLNGKYRFAKAEIESSVGSYIANKYFTVKTKGDLKIPEIVERVIEECFTPVKRTEKKFRIFDYLVEAGSADSWNDAVEIMKRRAAESESEDLHDALSLSTLTGFIDDGKPNPSPRGRVEDEEESDRSSLPRSGGNSGTYPIPTPTPNPNQRFPRPYPYPTPTPVPTPGPNEPVVEFIFKKELSESDKRFYYRQENYVDYTETISVPVYLSTTKASSSSVPEIKSVGKWDFIVGHLNEGKNPYRSEIEVKPGEQYVIHAAFAYQAESHYSKIGLEWYRWQTKWPSPDEDLYYRVGSGPWIKVNGRAVVRAESLNKGALQFYLDRSKIFDKIPEDYRKSKLIVFPPPVFTYAKTYPQFNVSVSGSKIEYKKMR